MWGHPGGPAGGPVHRGRRVQGLSALLSFVPVVLEGVQLGGEYKMLATAYSHTMCCCVWCWQKGASEARTSRSPLDTPCSSLSGADAMLCRSFGSGGGSLKKSTVLTKRPKSHGSRGPV